MKNTLVRLSVLSLALIGFGASSIVSHSQNTATVAKANVRPMQMPMCLPGDPSCCGLH